MFASLYFYFNASKTNTHIIIAIVNVKKLVNYNINMEISHVNITLYHNDNVKIIVLFLYKTNIGQFYVIIALSHNTKQPKSLKNMLTWLIFILILFPISICQQKHRDVTYFHNNSQVCHITLNVRVVVHVRKSNVHVIKSNVISFLLS